MRILLIEDDEKLSDTLKYQLEREQFSCDTSLDGLEGLAFAQTQVHDLIILDRMLPSMDGLTILQKIREQQIATPVILLTALGELQDKITGLNCGADDYIVKPFAFPELLARINCISRRPQKMLDYNHLNFCDLSYDCQQKILSKGRQDCALSRRESDLLELFLHNPQQTIPRGTILTKVWGLEADVEDGNLDNYIHFLRRRLKSLNSRVVLTTVRGIGYRLEENHV